MLGTINIWNSVDSDDDHQPAKEVKKEINKNERKTHQQINDDFIEL